MSYNSTLAHVFGCPTVSNTIHVAFNSPADGYSNALIGPNQHVRLCSTADCWFNFIQIDGYGSLPVDSQGAPQQVSGNIIESGVTALNGTLLIAGVPEVFKTDFLHQVISVFAYNGNGILVITKL